MPIEMIAKNSDIAAIGAEGNVERVTDEWNGAHDAFEGNIREHAREDMLRHTERMRLIEQVTGQRGGDEIADARDEPYDRLDAEADIGSGQEECGIEHGREPIDTVKRRPPIG
jgi:hypothetical protein